MVIQTGVSVKNRILNLLTYANIIARVGQKVNQD